MMAPGVWWATQKSSTKAAVMGGAVLVLILSMVGSLGIGAIAITAATSELQNQLSSKSNCSTGYDAIAGSDAPVTVGNVSWSAVQVQTAEAIINTANTLKLPQQAAVIALMTAMQESTMGASGSISTPNHDGDVGVFQQRAKPGWYADGATIEENTATLNDPSYAATTFLTGHTVAASYPGGNPAGYHITGLVDITGWETMTPGAAAQKVQRSAYPTAYDKWELPARALYASLMNSALNSTATTTSSQVICGSGTTANCVPSDPSVEQGLTPDALLVLRCAHGQFPTVKTFYGVGSRPAASGDDHATGHAVDIMVSSVYPDYKSADGVAFGNSVATWLQQNYKELGIHYLIWNDRIWNIDRDAADAPLTSWRKYTDPTGQNSDNTLHYNHVHVTVFGDAATGFSTAQTGAGAGAVFLGGLPSGSGWSKALAPGTYTVGCDFTCYTNHNGQDYPAAVGTPLYAVATGVVVQSRDLIDANGQYYSYGELIVIQLTSNPNVLMFYAHLNQRIVNVGDVVSAGQLIGQVGAHGHVTGPHLHLEIRVSGTPINPVPLLIQNGVIM